MIIYFQLWRTWNEAVGPILKCYRSYFPGLSEEKYKPLSQLRARLLILPNTRWESWPQKYDIWYLNLSFLWYHTALSELWDHDTGECEELSERHSQSPRLMVMCFTWPLSSSPLCSLALSSKMCAVGTTVRRDRVVFMLSSSARGLNSAQWGTTISASFFL